ncbi:glutathione ABC transporter permease GsiC, partial [Escherichia coli]|nr:glutathione ABC transporter permease GsiC [Escherichia coli]
DKPLYQQYFIWMNNLISGDFGRSFVLNRPVVDEVLERFSATLILGGSALLLSSILGLLAGVLSAIRQFSWSDRFIT